MTEETKRERYLRLFEGYSEKTIKEFAAYHRENPHIYEGFKRLAFEMRSTGRTKYSSKLIINVLRWETDLRARGDVEFKISDRFQSMYGRLLAYHHPEFEDFFNFRSVGKNRQYTEDWYRGSRDHSARDVVMVARGRK